VSREEVSAMSRKTARRTTSRLTDLIHGHVGGRHAVGTRETQGLGTHLGRRTSRLSPRVTGVHASRANECRARCHSERTPCGCLSLDHAERPREFIPRVSRTTAQRRFTRRTLSDLASSKRRLKT